MLQVFEERPFDGGVVLLELHQLVDPIDVVLGGLGLDGEVYGGAHAGDALELLDRHVLVVAGRGDEATELTTNLLILHVVAASLTGSGIARD